MKLWKYFKVGKMVIFLLKSKLRNDEKCDKCPFCFSKKRCQLYDKELLEIFYNDGYSPRRLKICREDFGL